MRTIIKVSVRFRKVRYLICGMLTIVTCLSGSGQGTCISGDCINGNGTYEFPSGSVFEGSFRDGNSLPAIPDVCAVRETRRFPPVLARFTHRTNAAAAIVNRTTKPLATQEDLRAKAGPFGKSRFWPPTL